MKPAILLVVLSLSIHLQAQKILTTKEKSDLLAYMAKSRSTNGFPDVKQKEILNEVSNSNRLKECAKSITARDELEDLIKFYETDLKWDDLSKLYDKMTAKGYHDLREKVIPKFNSGEYKRADVQYRAYYGSAAQLNDPGMKISKILKILDESPDLMKAFNKKRKENFLRENAFEIVTVANTDIYQSHRKSILSLVFPDLKNHDNPTAEQIEKTDDRIMVYLEYKYWAAVYIEGRKFIYEESRKVEDELKDCEYYLVSLLEKTTSTKASTKIKWEGSYSNEKFKLTIKETPGATGFFDGIYVSTENGSTEKGSWPLLLEETSNLGSGGGTATFEDIGYKIERYQKVTLTMEGNNMHYVIIGGQLKVTPKAGAYAPVPIKDGERKTGTLKRM